MTGEPGPVGGWLTGTVSPIGGVTARDRVTVQGRVVGSRVRTATTMLLGIVGGRVAATRAAGGGPLLEVMLADDSGVITLVFYGRSRLRGVRDGLTIRAAGRVADGSRHRQMANPRYELLPAAARLAGGLVSGR
jgi:hypothetical protein